MVSRVTNYLMKIGMDVPKEERDVNLCYWWEGGLVRCGVLLTGAIGL